MLPKKIRAMKILLSILLFPTLIFGQISNHFDNPSSKWYVAKTFPSGNIQNPNFVATTTTVFGFQGDSLINGETWYKLYSTQDSLFISNLIYKGITRSENNRILFIDSLNQLDTLYDFNLNVGDSVLYNFYGTMPEKIPVINIDSIQINGQFYRQFHFAEPIFPNAFDMLNELWIEGIGSIHGPLFPNFPFKFSTEFPDELHVTCTSFNNQQFWQNPIYNSCFINIVLSNDNKFKSDINSYPNPFSEHLKINMVKIDNYAIKIFNTSGQKVYEESITSDFVNIDLTGISDGIYFMTVESKSERWTSKLVRKHSL
jgi:hypothetical protein